ncbi:undecaprenyl-diphosphate phosphatase [Oscillospiraceae bacterium MB08-C2-2]|nr:undecaprenyl-diphosphate phosphatase [Oscillospiraceae bacterium MB08-C2-2]
MGIFDAVLQGIVQGLSEFLPISSSGHLSVVQYFTGQGGESGAAFSILLHLGTLLAVCLAFHKTILELIVEFFGAVGDIFKGRFSIKNASPQRRMLFLLIVSLVPLGAVVFLKDFYTSFSADNSIIMEGVCFLFTSLLLFLSERVKEGNKKAATMQYKDAVLIGCMQAVAPLPGLSRSGSTIAAGIFVGLNRKYAVAFSFIMGIPAVLGANLLEIKDIAGQKLDTSLPVLLVGLVTSLIFGLLAIKMVNWLVTSNKFKIFAWYTLVLGILVLGTGIFEAVSGHALQNMILGA